MNECRFNEGLNCNNLPAPPPSSECRPSSRRSSEVGWHTSLELYIIYLCGASAESTFTPQYKTVDMQQTKIAPCLHPLTQWNRTSSLWSCSDGTFKTSRLLQHQQLNFFQHVFIHLVVLVIYYFIFPDGTVQLQGDVRQVESVSRWSRCVCQSKSLTWWY